MERTILDRLALHAGDPNCGTAFVFLADGEHESDRIDFAQLHEAARCMAYGLAQRGLRGHRVLLMYQPGLDFIVTFFGCLATGAIPVPVSPPRVASDDHPWCRIATDCKASLLLLDAATERIIDKCPPMGWKSTLPVEVVAWRSQAHAADPKASCLLGPEANDLAFLQYTSGSTGVPKGVMVTHANIMANEASIKHAFGHGGRTVVLGWLPFHHDMGLVGTVMQPVFLGRPCVLMPSAAFIQKPLRWLKAMSHYGATTSGGPNFGYQLCLQAVSEQAVRDCKDIDLSGWSVAFAGAEPLRADVLRAFAERMQPLGFRSDALLPCYGMAESTLMLTGRAAPMPLQVHTLDRDELARGHAMDAMTATHKSTASLVSCGQSFGPDRVIVVDPDSRLPVPANVVGEVWASGPSIARGYWNDADLTRQVFQANLANETGPFFLRTGDLGYSRNNELVITGRRKELLIVNGRNYAPQDIEMIVQRQDPAFRPQAVVFMDEAAQDNGLVVIQEVYTHLARRLDAQLLGRRIRGAIADACGLRIATVVLTTHRLPVTTSGKIRRSACRDAWKQGAIKEIEGTCAA